MELKIYNPQEDGFLQKIDWNFEELKQELTAKVETYKNLVYSDDQMKEAKKDRAALRKFITALEDKRKEIKNQVMLPYTSFEKQEKELVSIVGQAVENIDIQIKGYEEGLRQEKLLKVQAIYEEVIGDLERTLPFEKLFKPEYTNASTTLKTVREEMAATVQRVDKELKLLNAETSPFVYEMKETYLKNLDMSEAFRVKQELEETQKKKEEYEALQKQKKEEEERKRQEEVKAIAEAGEAKEPCTEDKPEPVKEKQRALAITFKVTANEAQFSHVNQILSELQKNCMGFEIINKEEI